MTTKTPKKAISKKSGQYSIAIVLGAETIRGTGDSMLSALKSIPVPVKVTTKGIINLTDGSKKAELVWIVPKIKKLFQPLAQAVLAKQFNYLLK